MALRSAALFARGLIGEGGNNAVLGGLRFYFGQRDKTLIDRNRQDDPVDDATDSGETATGATDRPLQATNNSVSCGLGPNLTAICIPGT